MALLQPLINIAEICARHRVRQVILSPGSRSAHLTIAFARHPQITTRSISDERTAAFIALGIAQRSFETVGLVCTSGTAVLNYAPAIAEAFFQQIPLLVFTADRPAEWIAQQDGQTIYQRGIYGKHVKESYELPVDYSHPDAVWHVERIINEAVQLTQTAPKGPVHINVPIREPFYPTEQETLTYDHQVRIIDRMPEERVLGKAQWASLMQVWENCDKKLVVVGQHIYHIDLLHALRPLQEEFYLPVIGDVISNVHLLDRTIKHQDIFLASTDESLLATLQPDLLITFGQSVISKNLKLYLRKYRPYQHWHIQAAGPVADAFQSLTRIIPVEPLYFFRELLVLLTYALSQQARENGAETEYHRVWQAQQQKAAAFLPRFLQQQPFQEFSVVQAVLQALPDNSILHLANSMPVRYANFLHIPAGKNIEVFANRGTSGIDGSTSTAVGNALATDLPVVLLTGDVAFFYDRNAFWHQYIPRNLRVILLNNHGGNIFRLLDGPSRQPELEEYFETRQPLTARRAAADAGIDYFFAANESELLALLPGLFDSQPKAKLLEIATDGKANAAVFAQFKAQWKQR